MWRSDSCSSPAALASIVLAVALLAPAASSKVLLTRDVAIEQIFGEGVEIDRESVFLTDDQLEEARREAGEGVEIESALVTRHRVRRSGNMVGTVYLDTHRVRTLPQTVLVAVSSAGTLMAVRTLAFDEPEDYLPRGGWLDQFAGRSLDDSLAVKRGIDGITGATITAHATTDAVRRVLAIHGAIEP